MRLSQYQKADANQVTKVLVQYKACFYFFKSLLFCRCPFEDSFPISLSQLIQRIGHVTKAEYESSIETRQTRKNS